MIDGVSLFIVHLYICIHSGRDGCSANDLISDVIPNTAGSAHQLNQLLVSLLRALGFEVSTVHKLHSHIHTFNSLLDCAIVDCRYVM